jgi:hypothetical protein
MPNQRSKLIVLLVLQAIAIVIYPFSYFRQAPQAAVLPPALFVLFLVALFAMNSGGLSPVAGRSSLGFIQGINIVVRLLTFLPNLKGEGWNWMLLIAQAVGMGISWYALTQMEKWPPNTLLLMPRSKS